MNKNRSGAVDLLILLVLSCGLTFLIITIKDSHKQKQIEENPGVKFQGDLEFKNDNQITFTISYSGEYIIGSKTLYSLYEQNKISSVDDLTDILHTSIKETLEKLYEKYTLDEDILIGNKEREEYFKKLFHLSITKNLDCTQLHFQKFVLCYEGKTKLPDGTGAINTSCSYSTEHRGQ